MRALDRSLMDLGRTLQDTFFGLDRRRLMRQLQQLDEAQASRESLASASGIDDEEILDRLLELGVYGETFAALTLAPLVAVAWANGRVDERERDAVLAAAEASGLRPGEPSYVLLGRHLLEEPHPRLLETWKEFIGALNDRLEGPEMQTLGREILDRSRAIAEASRGALGLGPKVSRAEQRLLEELEGAFR